MPKPFTNSRVFAFSRSKCFDKYKENMAETFKLPPLEVEEYKLENGLRVVLDPDSAIPVVSVAVYYNVGSRNERDGRTGFAHLFEHMMFQGAENVPKAGHFQHIM